MTSSDDSKLWAQGVPLCEAWLVLLDADAPGYAYLAKYKALGGHLARDAVPNQSVPDGFVPKEGVARNKNREQLEQGLKADFHGLLESGEVIAIGDQDNPEIHDKPTRIPSSLFINYPNLSGDGWDDNFVRFGEKIIGRVRVVRRDAVVSSETVLQRGRPRKRDYLLEAAEVAAKDVTDFCNMPRKLGCDHVRNVLKNTLKIPDADEIGKSNKTVSKAIVIACRKLKASE